MTDHERKGLPAPVAEAFLICGEIWEDKHSGRMMLVGPTSHVNLPTMPAAVRLSVFARLTGGHGNYQLKLSLRNQDDESVWDCLPNDKLAQPDPLMPHQISFLNLAVVASRPGKYRMVLLSDDVEIAQQTLWITNQEMVG